MSKMKVSRRAAVVGMAAGLTAAPAIGTAAVEQNAWAPTELGLKLMGTVSGYVEAIYDDCNTCDAEWAPEYDAQKVAAVDKVYRSAFSALESAAEEIISRPVTEPAHLTDLAMIWTVWEEHHEGDENELQAVRSLVRAILKFGGISPGACQIGARYEAYKAIREVAVTGGAHA